MMSQKEKEINSYNCAVVMYNRIKIFCRSELFLEILHKNTPPNFVEGAIKYVIEIRCLFIDFIQLVLD